METHHLTLIRPFRSHTHTHTYTHTHTHTQGLEVNPKIAASMRKARNSLKAVQAIKAANQAVGYVGIWNLEWGLETFAWTAVRATDTNKCDAVGQQGAKQLNTHTGRNRKGCGKVKAILCRTGPRLCQGEERHIVSWRPPGLAPKHKEELGFGRGRVERF